MVIDASARLSLHYSLLSVMSYTATWQLWKHGRTYPLLDGTTPRRSLLLFTASPTAMPTEAPAPPPAAAARQLPPMVQGRPRAANTGAATPEVKATVAPTPAKVSVHAASVHDHSRSCILPLSPAECKHTKVWVPKKFFFEPTQYVLRRLALGEHCGI